MFIDDDAPVEAIESVRLAAAMQIQAALKALLFALSLVAGAMPFAFGVIRAVQTGGRDVRYVWVALASAVAAMAVARAARTCDARTGTVARAAAIFVCATIVAMVTATLLGTRIGPGGLIVATSFASCFAVAFIMRASG